jgi:regulatory protein
MLITKVEQGRGKRFRIYSDNDFVFALYGGEIKRYHLTEGCEMDEALVDQILDTVIRKRAKDRALYLLERRPYTCEMMRSKLKENDYPEIVIEDVIAFLLKYGYLDDEAYIGMYVNSYAERKSKKQLQYDLLRKGISKDLIADYMEQHYQSEENCFSKQFLRYTKGKDLSNRDVRQKIFRYFYGKGFSYSLIEEYMNRWESDSGTLL